MLDLIIKGAQVVDGSGDAARVFDVGVKDGKITFDTSGGASVTVDGEGLTLCPGFVESHSHSDLSVAMNHSMLAKVSQGVTTEVCGQCGLSAFPVDKRFVKEAVSVSISPDYPKLPLESFTDLESFRGYVNSRPLALNMVSLVGHNTLRASVMGVENRKPTPEELKLMKDRLRDAMEHGAAGMSSGLIYIPGVYCDTEELVELLKVVKPYGGIYATHMRNEAKNVVEAVKESIYVAKEAGVPLVISHHKICGRASWGKSEETLRLVEEAVKDGVNVMMDQYPYEANMTALNVIIPPEHFSGGSDALIAKLSDRKWRDLIAAQIRDPESPYDNYYLNSGGFGGVFISSCAVTHDAEGMTVKEYAEKLGKDEMETYFDLLVENKLVGNGIFFAMDPKEVEKIYLNERTMVGSDGLCFSLEEKGHPRAWATFIRPLCLFAQEKGIISFEQAVRKQTSLTASFWGIPNKGLIAEGYDADLVLIDRSKLKDSASYKNSNVPADGIEAVYVAGKCVYRDKKFTGEYPGLFLSCKKA